MTNFSAQVDNWVKKSNKRLDVVFKESAQRTFEMAQVPIGKGGRMRVDTGFLRASGKASLSGTPSGPHVSSGTLPADNSEATISTAKIGDIISYGWTANYAEIRNYKDGFMKVAIQNWQKTVNQVISDAKARAR